MVTIDTREEIAFYEITLKREEAEHLLIDLKDFGSEHTPSNATLEVIDELSKALN